jgi:autoinducer-2 kinase
MSQENLLMAIDLGTGGGRAAVFNEKGELKARAYRAWSYTAPVGMEVLCQEFDPLNFWKLLCECTREVLSKVDPKQVKAVSSTSMRQGCAFLDDKGNHLYAGPNRDVRGILFALEVEEQLGEERSYNITGRWPPWMFLPSRLRWFKEEQPEVFSKIAKILMLNDWILYMLSGESVGEPSNACESMVFDIKKKAWSKELLDLIGLSEKTLPRIGKTGELAGKVTAKAAKETGLIEGTKVVVGGADSQAALVACGQSRAGQLGLVAGTTLPVMFSFSEPFLDPEHKLWAHCHMFDGLYLLESQSGDAGKMLRGYVELHFGHGIKDNDKKYEELLKLAEQTPAGSAGVRVFMGSMVWDMSKMNPNSPAAVLFPFPPEENTAGPGNVGRAILEAVCFAALANLKQIEEKSGKKPDEVLLCGGMTRIRLFNKIMASVLKQPVKLSGCMEASALGVAMAAAVGAGIYPNLEAACKAMSGKLLEVGPEPDWVDEYDSSYDVWRENYDKLREW